jgi:ribosomal protein S18 acetylase RimI-like enzyme
MSAEDPAPVVRRAEARDEEAAVRLLLESGGAVYPRFAGSSAAALRILRAGFRRTGNTASAEIVTVAELDGEVAGAIAAFPVIEGAARARSYLRLSLARIPPWRWRQALRIFGALRPTPPPHALYVDALATSSDHRRCGVATALLDAAATEAHERGCTHVALETEIENGAARSLYGGEGFEETGTLPPVASGLGEGYVCLVRTL